MGDLTLGALVAVIGAHEKLYAPWKELLELLPDDVGRAASNMSRWSCSSIRAGLRDDALQSADPGEPLDHRQAATLQAINVSVWRQMTARWCLEGAKFSVDLPKRIAIVGPTGAGKADLAQVLANLLVRRTPAAC